MFELLNVPDRPLALRGELTVFEADVARRALLDAGPAAEIDVTGLTALDTAGLQLLLAWVRRSGTRPVLVGLPTELRAVLALAGLTAALDLRSVS